MCIRDSSYTGINAAGKTALLGDLGSAAEYASRVEALVGTAPTPGDYWRTATAAEAQLIQGHYEAAVRLYEEAVACAPDEAGSHRTTWSAASRLLAALSLPATVTEQLAVILRTLRARRTRHTRHSSLSSVESRRAT